MNKYPNEIDIVYTWVNGDDPDYLALYNRYAARPKDLNPERIRDVYQTLRYSLRSVEMYAPWVRHIYLVTMRPQVPAWLNTAHPRIKVIHHDEIFDREDLPTFNYNVIESHIHRIPELSEHFIYMNDDFLFGNWVDVEDFFDATGRILIHGTLFGENLGFRIDNGTRDIIGLGLVEHSPILIKREFWQLMQDARPEAVKKMKSHKFRERSDVMMYKLYRWYMLKYQRRTATPIRIWDLLKIHTFHKLTNNFGRQRRALKQLEHKSPKFYCLNDDQRDNPNPRVAQLVQDFLNRKYPGKSAFEN